MPYCGRRVTLGCGCVPVIVANVPTRVEARTISKRSPYAGKREAGTETSRVPARVAVELATSCPEASVTPSIWMASVAASVWVKSVSVLRTLPGPSVIVPRFSSATNVRRSAPPWSVKRPVLRERAFSRLPGYWPLLA